MRHYLGIDPGASGGAALLTPALQVVDVIKFKDGTEDDIGNWFWQRATQDSSDVFAVLEKVNAMPKQGVSSSFKFGMSYGFLRGVLATLDIQREFVRPAQWQRALGCLSKGDKNVTKARAQELFPGVKVTHAIADALLLGVFAQKTDPAR